jgi:peptide-methionine (S)-S-oxide reductase
LSRALVVLCQLNLLMNAAETPAQKTERATFGGGCFWCVEAVFERLEGVKSVINGYSGGAKVNPTYREVCSGDTGHAEVVQVEFDPQKITYAQLLSVFWEAHDPTTLNRQGGDTGTQYRSVIFYHDATQKAEAERSKQAAASKFPRPIVTEIVPLDIFFSAEAYHQDYYRNNSQQGYCQAVIRPKLEKLQIKLKPLEKKP